MTLPSSESEVYKSLELNETVKVVNNFNEWSQIELSTYNSSKSEYETNYGYIKTDLLNDSSRVYVDPEIIEDTILIAKIENSSEKIDILTEVDSSTMANYNFDSKQDKTEAINSKIENKNVQIEYEKKSNEGDSVNGTTIFLIFFFGLVIFNLIRDITR